MAKKTPGCFTVSTNFEQVPSIFFRGMQALKEAEELADVMHIEAHSVI